MPELDDIVYVINRTTKPFDIIDNGRVKTIPAGYKVVPDIDPETGEQRTETVKDEKGKKVEQPKFKVVGAGKHDEPLAVPVLKAQAIRGRRQHILRGSQDPLNPTFAITLCACPDLEDPYDWCEQTDKAELFDRSGIPLPPGTTLTTVVNPHHISNRRAMNLDEKSFNPVGMRMEYENA